jgi:hypothetical protein
MIFMREMMRRAGSPFKPRLEQWMPDADSNHD